MDCLEGIVQLELLVPELVLINKDLGSKPRARSLAPDINLLISTPVTKFYSCSLKSPYYLNLLQSSPLSQKGRSHLTPLCGTEEEGLVLGPEGAWDSLEGTAVSGSSPHCAPGDPEQEALPNCTPKWPNQKKLCLVTYKYSQAYAGCRGPCGRPLQKLADC